MNDQIIEDLRWRYSTKRYDKNLKISEKNLNTIFEAIRLTPSSINSQPWKLIVIESDDARLRLSKTFEEKFKFNVNHVFESSQIILFAHNPYFSLDDYKKIVEDGVRDGRTHIDKVNDALKAFTFVEDNTDKNGFNGNWSKAQVYIALGNVLHTLARLRIDSTPIEGITSKRVNEEFQNELSGYECHVCIAIGYHSESEDYNRKLPKSRRDLKDILIRL